MIWHSRWRWPAFRIFRTFVTRSQSTSCFRASGMTYQLDGPALPGGELVSTLKTISRDFAAICMSLDIRYSFERYGVTYVAAIYCLDTRPRSKILTCRQADRVMERFLRALKLAGGTPSANPTVGTFPLDPAKKRNQRIWRRGCRGC